MMIIRFVKFLQNAAKSSKLAVQMMLQRVTGNVSTVTGGNISSINNLMGKEYNLLRAPITLIKKHLHFFKIAVSDEWRVSLIKEITNMRQSTLVLLNSDNEEFLNSDQIKAIADFVSSS